MNSKNIAKSLKRKIDDWCASIDDDEIVKQIKENAIITGGALVSMLNNEYPNDYDIYFKTHESCLEVASYYAKRWNEMHPESAHVKIQSDSDTDRITAFISSIGIADEDAIDDESEPESQYLEEKQTENKQRYRPRYFSTNAIALSDKIQLVIRFYGSVDEIHENYDFVHCTCSYDYKENKVNLPVKALEAIINKELFYVGSKYPLCSIIRTRKFIKRGWSINAGQYLKMCLQLNEFNLKDIATLRDQTTGVDSMYFNQVLAELQKKQDEDSNFKIDNSYLFEIIDRIF